MRYYKNRASRLGQAPQPTHQLTTIPASVGGVNALESVMAMPVQDCIYAFNLMPSEYGQRIREGYQVYAENMTGDVRTILPFEASSEDFADDKLWAVTDQGMWDISTASQAPTQVSSVVFTDNTEPAGYGVHCEFTADNGDHYLLYADGANGVWQYKEGDDPITGWQRPDWIKEASQQGTFDVTQIAFVMVYQSRIWIIQRNSTDAWYGPVAAIGAPNPAEAQFTKFVFGAKMEHGGNLQGLWSWSYDGGDGLNDFLVGLSRGGDVIVYRGLDPEAPDWQMAGSWFIGETPEGRRVAKEVGSDLYMLSVFGLASIRDLMRGELVQTYANSPSAKVNRFLRADIQASKDSYEWAIVPNPSDGFTQIIAPKPGGGNYVQYNQNVNTKAWGFWENVPMISADNWNGEYYIGSESGVVYIYTGDEDNVAFDGTGGEPIGWRSLTSFQVPDGVHSVWHQTGVIRAVGILASNSVTFNIDAVYDYDVGANLPQPGDIPSLQGATWGPNPPNPDPGVWNEDVWAGGQQSGSTVVSVMGHGRVVAIAIRGLSVDRATLIGYDYSYRTGGML